MSRVRMRPALTVALGLALILLAAAPVEAQGPVHSVFQIHFLDPGGSGVITRTDSYGLFDPASGTLGDWGGRFWVIQDPAAAGRSDPIVVAAYEMLVSPGDARQSRFAVLRYDGARFSTRQFMNVGPPNSEIHFLRLAVVGGVIKMNIFEGTNPSGDVSIHHYDWVGGVAFNEVFPTDPGPLPRPLEDLERTPDADMHVGIGFGVPFTITTNVTSSGGSRFHLIDTPSPESLIVEADPKGGDYTATQAVVLSASSPTATIRYTTDGSDPGAGSPVFTGRPILILPYDPADGMFHARTTLKFQATEAGRPDSAVVSETYTVVQPKSADTDGDGLLDIWEAGHGRGDLDVTGDGVLDNCVRNCREAGGCVIPALSDHCFDPLVADADVDCDLDGWSDLDEIRLGSNPACGDSVPALGSEMRRVRIQGTATRPDAVPATAGSIVETISPRGSGLRIPGVPPAVTDPAGIFLDATTRGESDVILRIADRNEPQVVLHRLVPIFAWSDFLPPRLFDDADFTNAADWFGKYKAALQYDVCIEQALLGGACVPSLAVDARSSTILQVLEHTVETDLPALVADYIGIPIADVDRPPLGDFPGPGDIDLPLPDGDRVFTRLELTLGERGKGLTGQQAAVLLLHGTDVALLGDTMLDQVANGADPTYRDWAAFGEDVFRAVPQEPLFHGTTDEVLTDVMDDKPLDANLAARIGSLPPAAPVLPGPAEVRPAAASSSASMAPAGPAPLTLPTDLPGLVAAVRAAAATTAAIYGRIVARGERGVYRSGDPFGTGRAYRAIVGALVAKRAGNLGALADIAAGAEEAARAVEEARALAAGGRAGAIVNLMAGIGVIAAALDEANGDPAALLNLNARMAGLVYRIDRAAGDPVVLVQLESSASDYLQPDTVPPVVTASPAGPLFTGVLTVTLVSDEPATLYYTLDGSTPVPGGASTFSGANEVTGITLTSDTTLSFFGIDVPWMNAGTVRRITYLRDTDGDGIADVADNCPLVANLGQEDFDGDLLGDACDPNDDNDARDDFADCRPLDPTLWASPGESPITLTFLDQETLQWTSLASAAGPATVYDVARGPLSDLHGGQPPGDEFDGVICLYDNTVNLPLTATDAEVPASGQGFYYLLRGDNACGVGLYGRRSNGGERVILACP